MTSDDLDSWHAIYDLALAYAEGIDTRNWTAFGELFDDTVTVDFSSFSHRPAPPEPITRAEWVAAVRGTIDGFPSTQHLIGNQRISLLSGVEGRYTAYIQAQHWADRDRWYLIGGWYENSVRRIGGQWKLTAVTLHQTWDAGDRGLLREMSQRMRGATASGG